MSPKKSSASSSPLACPTCALRYSLDERFCARCKMPLVYVGSEPLEEPVTDAHGKARKINPAFTEGELVRVAGGRNQAEAEFIQGLLLEEGVPSILRRSAGFDVPDFLAAGPRDVMVPQAGAETAQDVLMSADLAPPQEQLRRPRALVLLVVIGGGSALVALIAWALLQAGA